MLSCLCCYVAHVVAAAGFLSHYLNGPLPYVFLQPYCYMPYNRKYNVLSASLNKTSPSFMIKDNSNVLNVLLNKIFSSFQSGFNRNCENINSVITYQHCCQLETGSWLKTICEGTLIIKWETQLGLSRQAMLSFHLMTIAHRLFTISYWMQGYIHIALILSLSSYLQATQTKIKRVAVIIWWMSCSQVESFEFSSGVYSNPFPVLMCAGIH